MSLERPWHAAAVSLCLVAMTGTWSTAQSWDTSQKEVWQAVLGSYQDIEKEDAGWTDKWVMPNAAVWGDYPMPRTRETVSRWDEFNFERSDTLVSEYSPAAIVVHEDMAVAHYYYSTGDKNAEGGSG